MKNVYCIVGPSGSGKTTLTTALKEKYGYTAISSYTTRPARFEGETGHVFVSPDEFKELRDVYAYNQYDGYDYGITAKQLEENDLYVVDPSGAEDLLKRYHGNKNIKVIGLQPNVEVLIERMRLRGDSDDMIINRLIEDANTFKNLDNFADVIFTTDFSVETLCVAVNAHIENFEYWAKHDFTLLNERGEEVTQNCRNYYTLDEAIGAYSKVNPEGLPEGWSIRDDTAEAIKGYVKAIHKCRPSFKTSMIRVDESNAGRSSDGYTAVRFCYKDKTYFYRKHNGDAWIDEYVRPSDTRSPAEVLAGQLDGLCKRMRRVDREVCGEYRYISHATADDLKTSRKQMSVGVGFLKKALRELQQERHCSDVPLLDDVIQDAKNKLCNSNNRFYENKDIFNEKEINYFETLDK